MFNSPEDKDEGIFQCFADNGYGVAASVRVNFREAKLARFPFEERQVYLFIQTGKQLKLSRHSVRYSYIPNL